MQNLHIKQTATTPEIKFSPDENIFLISGTSAPEDVRALYYPVIEWTKIFVDDIIDGEYKKFSKNNPLDLHIDLTYFNSSSAKFLYDILAEIKRIPTEICAVLVSWNYDAEDVDMIEAGKDIASLVEMEFRYIPKSRN
ncbi:MAG: DUF1987 domain-containing protein [Bacteroidota bacterium]